MYIYINITLWGGWAVYTPEGAAKGFNYMTTETHGEAPPSAFEWHAIKVSGYVVLLQHFPVENYWNDTIQK